MRNFLKIFFISWLIQTTIHSFSFADIGFQSAGMELFNPKNPFKTSFTPLKDKVLIYTYLDHDHQGVSNWVDSKINAGIKPKQKVAFVNDYVVFLNDHNKDIVKDLDQNLKFEGSKVDVLIVHPDSYVPGSSYGPWRTFKYDPLYQSGDPKDFVELIRTPGKKPIKEEMKVLINEKIHQLTKNDNFKKFFNNKPMNIKPLNETINGRWLVSTRSNANNDGECSAYLKERFSNNIDPKNFHIVIVPFSRCLYANDIFNFFTYQTSINGLVQSTRPILGFVQVAEIVPIAFENVEKRKNKIKQATSNNPDDLVLINLRIGDDGDVEQEKAKKSLTYGNGVCIVGENNSLKSKAVFINHFNKKYEKKGKRFGPLNMKLVKFFKDTNTLYDFIRKNKKEKYSYFIFKECLNMFVPVKDMDKLKQALKAEKIWQSGDEPKLFSNLNYTQIVHKYYGVKDETEYSMLASNYLNFKKDIFDQFKNDYKINSLTILENNFNEMMTNMPNNRGRSTEKKTADLLYYLKNKDKALNSKGDIKIFFANLNTDEIKKAKERAEQARIQRLKTIEDYKKNGAPLTGYQMKNDYGKLFVECEYAMGSNILFPFNEFSTPMLANWGCPPTRRVN